MMNFETISKIFETGGYTLMILLFILYFGYQYLTIKIAQEKKRIERELKPRNYHLRGVLEKDEKEGQHQFTALLKEHPLEDHPPEWNPTFRK